MSRIFHNVPVNSYKPQSHWAELARGSSLYSQEDCLVIFEFLYDRCNGYPLNRELLASLQRSDL